MGDDGTGLVAEVSEKTGPESVCVYRMQQIQGSNDFNQDSQQCKEKQRSQKVFDEIRHKILFIVLTEQDASLKHAKKINCVGKPLESVFINNLFINHKCIYYQHLNQQQRLRALYYMLQEYYAQTPFPNNLRTPAPHLPTPLPHHKQYNEAEGLIYGTTIQVHKVMALIQRFILEFQISRKIEDEYVSERIYRIKLNDLPEDQSVLFEVEGAHLREFDRELYLQFIYYPAEMISIFDMVLKNLFGRYFVEPQTIDSERTNREMRQAAIMVGIKSLHVDDVLCVRELGPKNIGKLVMIKAIVIRMSEVYPQMKRAWFRCENCFDEVAVPLLNAKVQEPEVCRVCNFKQTMQIIHNFCSFTDKQYIKIQELPELVTEGETPSSLTVISYDTNVDGVRPGDRVSLIGIYRAQPSKIDRMKGTVRSIFNIYLDLISFNVISQNRYSAEKKTVFTDNQKMAFHKFADKQNVIDNLVRSFAPSIFGHQNVKLGILAQLFGGSKKDLPNRGSTRSDINVCIVGDPSTSKSQLLQQVHRIAPRSVYTSGRGSSAVGLTCSVRKDPDSGEFVLQSGALVLADQGICCIDQFDKMQQNSRTILLEAMQQQTISIAKAGIVCQLNSRTAILAAANPVGSKYNTRRSVVDNINLSPSILSRFDLIYILLDVANEASDIRLATHILDFYMSACTQKTIQGPLNLKQLTRYITYAREYVRPILTERAGKKLQSEYVSMRLKGMTTKTITATPRQLQSLIRMSEAFAKMRLSNQANEEDVEMAVVLMLDATMSAATNLETGIIDMDVITTGRSSMEKKRIFQIADKMRQFLLNNESKYRRPCTVERLLADFNSFDNNKKFQIHVQDLLEGIKILQADQLLSVFGQNKNNPSFKLQINSED